MQIRRNKKEKKYEEIKVIEKVIESSGRSKIIYWFNQELKLFFLWEKDENYWWRDDGKFLDMIFWSFDWSWNVNGIITVILKEL